MKFITKKDLIVLGMLLLIGILLSLYAYGVKSEIITARKEGIKRALTNEKLNDQQKQYAQDALTRLEKGQLIPDEEHNTGDFMHQEYFGDPWRKWENTVVLAYKSRNLFFILILMILIKHVWTYFYNKKRTAG